MINVNINYHKFYSDNIYLLHYKNYFSKYYEVFAPPNLNCLLKVLTNLYYHTDNHNKILTKILYIKYIRLLKKY